MKDTLYVVALVVFAAAALAGEVPLFEMTVTKSPAGGPVGSTLKFKEVERTATTSIIEMVYTPSRLGPDLVDLTNGVCFLMKYRGEQFVQTALTSQNPLRFEVTFPRLTAESPLGSGGPLSLAQCERFISRR
jgi:hypothetical protein